jgi:hypothetical protein
MHGNGRSADRPLSLNLKALQQKSEDAMTPTRTILLAALCLAGTCVAAAAQSPPPAYSYAQYSAYQAPPTPPSWSYDPYTSGMAPCPQGIPGDLQKCRDKMPPSYGQPSYWPTW